MKQALADAGSSIDHVVLVGGMTRMPAVQEKVSELTGKDPHKGVNPDEGGGDRRRDPGRGAVRGRQGRAAARRHPADPRHRDQGRRDDQADRAQHTIPSKKSEIFSTADDNQPSVEIHVLQGGAGDGERQQVARQVPAHRDPAAPRGLPQIEVTFDIDANGILSVAAKDLGTGKEQTIEIKGGSGLEESEVEQMIKDAESHAEDDRKQRELAEARNVAENAAYTAEKQVGEMDEQLDEAAKTEINDAIKAVRDVLDSTDVEEIKAKTEALQSAFHKVSEQIYAAAAEQQAAEGASTNGAGEATEDEVVDAEVVDDDRA